VDQRLNIPLWDTSMIHKQGMKSVSDQRLLRRKGTYYYRRRVPVHLVERIGKRVIQVSLHTTNFKQAKKLRTLRDLEWDAQFEAADPSAFAGEEECLGSGPAAPCQPLPKTELVELVRDYVERHDRQAEKRDASCYPETAAERAGMRMEAELEAQILRGRDHPQTQQWLYMAGKEVLKPIDKSLDDPDVPGEALAELVRRALLELNRRHLARLADDHGHTFFDQLFNPGRPAKVTFGELAEQWLRLTEEEAAINAHSQKGVDRQRATLGLIREIVGDKSFVEAIDYDACLRVRSILAHLPANRTKLYGNLPIDQAIKRAAKEEKPLLSPVTQQQYLSVLRDVLDLAAKKRLIAVNPAERLRPIRRDLISASDKRRPFTLQQIANLFKSPFYAACAKHSPPFAHDKTGWRFWLPLMCLFMGMRPNEAAQMHLDDLKCTTAGTWFLHIVATDENDEAPQTTSAKKTVKTANSRRKIPLHPELIKIGFLQFVEQRKKAGAGPRLFPDLKPDKYGNHASYALKRFRETYLPAAIKMEARQSFYSSRHSWRDALRRIDAQPATLQALGAWSQGKLTSDEYGDKFDPDYQAQFIKKISFPGLDLSGLHVTAFG
jgi:integrase